MSDNPWAWWQAALADPGNHQLGKTRLASESHPEQGFYRVRNHSGNWEPVAIWFDDYEKLRCLRGNVEIRGDQINDLWTRCLRNPLAYTVYERARDGKGWDDEPPAPTEPPAPPIGHNSGSADPFDALHNELAGEKEQADGFLKQPVKTKADADRLGIWAKRFLDLKKRLDDGRKVEKEPHLRAGKSVDAKWAPDVEDAAAYADKLRDHLKPFLLAQKREEEERQRQARMEAERARLAANEASTAIGAGTDPDDLAERMLEAGELAAEARRLEHEAEARRVQAGRTGAKVTIKVIKKGVVDDYATAATALVAMRYPDIIALIDQLANRAAREGKTFDGMHIVEDETVV